MKASISTTEAALMSITAALLSATSTFCIISYLKRLQDAEIREKSLAEYEVEKREAEEKRKGAQCPVGTLIQDVRIDEIYLWECVNLGRFFPSEAPNIVNHMLGVGSAYEIPDDVPDDVFTSTRNLGPSSEKLPKGSITHYNKLIGIHECILADLVRKPGAPGQIQKTSAYVRAGARRNLHFLPSTVNAAIVTCGGLCPGLNNVVREITNSLVHLYGVKGTIYGIRGGFNGFVDLEQYPPLELTPDLVEDIHHKGGTVLSSSRGGFDLDKIIDFVKKRKINQLYVIGGDGTHRGAFAIHEGCLDAGINVAVAGIPKVSDDVSIGDSANVHPYISAIVLTPFAPLEQIRILADYRQRYRLHRSFLWLRLLRRGRPGRDPMCQDRGLVQPTQRHWYRQADGPIGGLHRSSRNPRERGRRPVPYPGGSHRPRRPKRMPPSHTTPGQGAGVRRRGRCRGRGRGAHGRVL